MESVDKKLDSSIKKATILSGAGMGLLLGLIMGLSASEVVQTIFGVLTAMLGAFLGFDKRSFASMQSDEYEKEKYHSLHTGLRAGWFGIAVVMGILSGMWIRTQEVMNITVENRVKQWTDAGYEPEYARKLVALQILAIDPNTGEAKEMTAMQRITQGALFNAQTRASLCGTIDPGIWNNDWQKAKEDMLNLKVATLDELVNTIEKLVPAEQRFDFLWGLRVLVCEMNAKKTLFCNFGSDLSKWKNNEDTRTIAVEIEKLDSSDQKEILKVLSAMVCQLEKD